MGKTFYIITPSNYVTGGIEAEYQLCDSINKQGGNAYLLFVNGKNLSVPDEYSHYDAPSVYQIDNEDGVIVFPEVYANVALDESISGYTRIIWWLSVDNARSQFDFSSDNDIIHCYQSEYARMFLLENGAKRTAPLFDYLNDKYLCNEEIKDKSDMVCYSIKGAEFAESISSKINAKMVMLKDMSRDEVIDTLLRSKVFIDFGNHPGKDRIPREAAILMNCVITNKKGSAKNSIDVRIPDSYKIDCDSDAISVINECVKNYDSKKSDFDDYRSAIMSEKEEFFYQVKNLIGYV